MTHLPQITPPICCLCGLLCPVPMKWPDHDQPPACSRLHAWLNIQDTLRVKQSSLAQIAEPAWFAKTAQRLQTALNPLVWLESCDVETTRAAIRLAENCGATLHVAQSPGEHLVSSVMSSIGWQGTSLAELHHAATLIVHVGQQHLREMPLLLARFAPDSCEHIFLDQCPADVRSDELAGAEQSVIELGWQRHQWLDGVMRTLLAIRDDSVVSQRRAVEMDASAGLLAERLLVNRYCVILWNQNELTDHADRLLLERLVELTDAVGQITRCTLLPLASDPGRVTSKDTVLWLTNGTTPLKQNDSGWQPADFSAGLNLDQWQARYDYRLCVRSLPSDTPLPEMAFHALIDADSNVHQSGSHVTDTCYVSSVGLNGAGHLTRGDHGLAAFASQLDHDAPKRATAWEVLERLSAQLSSRAPIDSGIKAEGDVP